MKRRGLTLNKELLTTNTANNLDGGTITISFTFGTACPTLNVVCPTNFTCDTCNAACQTNTCNCGTDPCYTDHLCGQSADGQNICDETV